MPRTVRKTVPAHPVWKRVRVHELGTVRLPFALLTPSLIAILALFALVGTTSSSFEFSGLSTLRPPDDLRAESARRAAAMAVRSAVIDTAIEIDAVTTGDHVEAMVRHMILADRPVHAPRLDTVRPNESVTQFRRRWRLDETALRHLNPEVDLDRVSAGDALCVWRYDPAHPTRSLLRPNRGRLENGEPMPEGNGWVIRQPPFAYGARQTIDGLTHAIRQVMASHPGGQDMMIADISKLGGGRLAPHVSHQSGRDVDVTFYRLTDEAPTFSRTRVSELDLKRNWAFIRTLLVSHDIEYMFVSRPIQRALFAYAESIGEHPAFLNRVFETGTHGHRNARGIIRFAPGHDDHIHIRFGCLPQDYRCSGSAHVN